MAEPRVYTLYFPVILKILIVGMLVVFTVLGVMFASGMFFSPPGPPRIVGLFWLGIIVWWGYWISSIPHKIVVYEGGEIEFISLGRHWRMAPFQIQSIKPYAAQPGYLVVRTSSGKIRLLNQFDGFHEFLTRLKTDNPSIELRGC